MGSVTPAWRAKSRAKSKAKRRANVARTHIDYPSEKHCHGCQRTLPASGFHKSRREDDGLNTRCKECTNKYQKNRYNNDPSHSIALSNKYRRDQSAKRDKYLRGESTEIDTRTRREMRQYGLSVEDFEAMNKEQDGKCKICGVRPEQARGHRSARLYIDHCHETGTVRGLLCSRCNSAIGYFDDCADKVSAALNYLSGASNGDKAKT